MDLEELKSRVESIVSSLEDSKENPKSRENVTCTLNLDKNSSLRAFVERICKELRAGALPTKTKTITKTII